MIAEIILSKLTRPRELWRIDRKESVNIFGRVIGVYETRKMEGHERQTVDVEIVTGEPELPKLGEIGERFGFVVFLVAHSGSWSRLGRTYRFTCAFYPIVSPASS